MKKSLYIDFRGESREGGGGIISNREISSFTRVQRERERNGQTEREGARDRW